MADQPKARARRAAATPVTRAPDGENLETLLAKLADKVQTVIRDLVNDVTTLEVRTFVCNQEDLTKAGYDVGKHAFVSSDGTPVEIELRALTAIELDGDINSCMPYVGGKLDTDLWTAHLNMVAQAQKNRAEFVAALAELARGLTGK